MLAKNHVDVLRGVAASIPSGSRTESIEHVASAIEYELADRAKRDSEYQALQDIGKSAAESIAEMVAALECDYERLEELRDELGTVDDDIANGCCKFETRELDEMRQELGELEKAVGECESRADAEQRIHEDPLSVEVRSGWYEPTANHLERQSPEEFCILLGTGGPATRIIGELNEHGEPTRARLQAQDWFKPWTDYTGDAVSDDDLLTYCRCFYFGE